MITYGIEFQISSRNRITTQKHFKGKILLIEIKEDSWLGKALQYLWELHNDKTLS